ncbi:MAG: hypothetical protein KAR83_01770 [Thermodesulfovibrionales bacterium]|nr:hypothetical protein [Thermodesulfovibrionales bacterium]
MRRRYFIGFFLMGGLAGIFRRRLLGPVARQIKGGLKRARYYRRLDS